MVWLGLSAVPLVGSNRTNVVLVGLNTLVLMRVNEWPALVLSHNPALLEPSRTMLLSLGSTWICSPSPRPLELPPT